ncbi:uncharacterized protein LOC142224729 [Haematobia irritans]|uniref:uncharacterized protein LOC142224729 n=1 Tax=Haematobia irritans TaxID=7368 RepID=UPI003F4F841A
MSRVSQSHRGITWGLQGNLCDLDYADDICLIAHKGTEIQGMLNDLNKYAVTAGMSINIQNTKAMRINASNNDTIAVDRKPIENVNTFCYLGSIITSDGGTSEDIKNRLNKGRAAFAPLEKAFQVFINRCLRKIVRIFWPNTITKEELWRTTEQQPALLEIEEENGCGSGIP